MSKTTIDWTIWATATTLAEELKATPQMVNNWRRRNKVEAQLFPELGKYLYKRGSVTVKTINK